MYLYSDRPSLPRPLRERLQQYLQEFQLEVPNIFPRSPGPIPPWSTFAPEIDLQLTELQKSSTSNLIYLTMFRSMQETYSETLHIYTDGSKTETGSGCAVLISERPVQSFKLPTCYSVFSSEAWAIYYVLRNLQSTPPPHMVIFSDSLSVLNAISNQSNKNPLIQQIQALLLSFNEASSRVTLSWIPSHKGIPGNTTVDTASKEATTLDIIEETPCTHTDFKKYAKMKVQEKWNTSWTNRRTALRNVRNNVYENSLFLSNRAHQIKITRLRIGHTNLTHIHRITKTLPQPCPKCGEAVTTEHLLLQCSATAAVRHRFPFENTLRLILGSSQQCEHVINFLRAVNLLNKI